MSQFFAKFQYKGNIKKIPFNEDTFTWKKLLSTLSVSFNVRKEKIELTYKDADGDEITVCNDEELKEACRVCPASQMVKFFVYKSNSIPARKTEVQQEVIILKDSEGFAGKLSNSHNSEKMVLDSKNSLEEEENKFERSKSVPVDERKDVQKEIRKISVDLNDIKTLLEDLLLSREGQKRIKELISSSNISKNDKEKQLAELVFDVDSQRMADCALGVFNKALNEAHTRINSEESGEKRIGNNNDKIFEKYKEEEKCVNEKNMVSDQIRHMRHLSSPIMQEPIYEAPNLDLTGKLTKTLSLREQGFPLHSFSQDTHSNFGVKLTMRLENGKMKFVSVPSNEYSFFDDYYEERNTINMQNELKNP